MSAKNMGYRDEFEHTDENVCPWCGSSHVEITGSVLAMEDSEDRDEKFCVNCKAKWSERSDGFIRRR